MGVFCHVYDTFRSSFVICLFPYRCLKCIASLCYLLQTVNMPSFTRETSAPHLHTTDIDKAATTDVG